MRTVIQNMKKIYIFMILAVLIALNISGCKETVTSGAEDGEYLIYYLENDGISLVMEKYEAKETESDKLIAELMNKMNNPNSDKHKTVYAEKFVVNEFSLEKKVLYIHFSEGYSLMDDVEEVLFRSSMVRVMCQIEGVDYVSFYINEQPLTNDTGNVVGLMASEHFIDSTSDSLNNLQWAEMNLYFADSSGQNLICEKRDVAYGRNVSLEMSILENLIKGPENGSAKRALPRNLKILGVSVKDGICYVNFDSSFLNAMVDASADVTIYSMVNSLCELPNVKQVQILVDGSSEKTFMDKYPLTTLFERNLNLVIVP